MRHSQYNAYGREIARRNKKIGHTEARPHFARMILSTDEWGSDNIAEFINGIKNTIRMPAMIWIAYEHQINDNGGDQFRKVYRGSYLLLDAAPENKYETEEQTYDRLEEIGDEITAFMIADFAQKMNDPAFQPKVRLLTNDISGQKLGRVEELLAMRFDFAFWCNYNGPMFHKPENWID